MTPAGRNSAAAPRWPARPPRVPVLAISLSIAIHVALYWLMPQLASGWRELPELVYSAILVPEPAAATAPKAATPAPPKRSRPVAKPAPPAAVPSDAVSKPASDAIPEEGAAGDGSGAGPTAAVPDANAISAPVEGPAAAPVTAPDPEQPALPSSPVELPSRISLSFKATSSISDGVADYSWKREGNRYETESSLQATGFFISMFAGVMHQVSQGEVDANGLKPDSFRFRRGEGEAEVAEFARLSNELRLTRGGRTRTQPLPPGIQDTQSFLFQFAYEAARLQGVDDRLDVLVTNARKVYRHRFKVVGKETIETRFGAVPTLHLRSEAVDPEDVYEVWLSPENHHLPVKLKFFAGRFPIELIATSIRSTP